MEWTEILGFVTGALSVLLYTRQNVWAWPVGIANIADGRAPTAGPA